MKRVLVLFLLLISSVGTICGRTVYPLSEGWRFQFAFENDADRARYVSLPHTWNGDALVGTYPYLRTQGTYFRTLYVPYEWAKKRVFLRFGSVENVADLFINGSYVDSHRGAGVAFTIEITDYLVRGEENEIFVAVSNTLRNDLMPAATERNCYGGIVREVDLLVTDPVTISPLYYGTDGLFVQTEKMDETRAEGQVRLHLSVPTPQAVEVNLRACDEDGNCCFEQRRVLKSNYDFSRPIEIPFSILEPRAWSPESPTLYRFSATVSAGESSDEVHLLTGLRTVSLTPDGLRINGQRVDLRGLALAYDHPARASLMSAREYDADFELLQEVGANALLSPAAPHAPYLYERCDREGMLARIDLPFIRTNFLSDLIYYGSTDFEAHGIQLLREIILQHMNHPSVIMWGIFTDLKLIDKGLLDYLKRLNAVAREVDPLRPTVATSNQDGDLNFITNGVAWHQRLGWVRGRAEDIGVWLRQMGEKWRHLASAIHYGAEGFLHQQPDCYEKPEPFTLDLPERRQSRYHEEYLIQLATDTLPLLWGHWVDGLSDYGSARRDGGLNGSGLVSFDRHERKDAFYLYKARWNREKKTLHIADKRWAERPSEPQQLYVYASETDDPIDLLVNGDTVLLERLAPNIYRSEEFMPEQENWVEVRMGQMRDELFFRSGSELKRPRQQAPLQTIGLSPIN